MSKYSSPNLCSLSSCLLIYVGRVFCISFKLVKAPSNQILAELALRASHGSHHDQLDAHRSHHCQLTAEPSSHSLGPGLESQPKTCWRDLLCPSPFAYVFSGRKKLPPDVETRRLHVANDFCLASEVGSVGGGFLILIWSPMQVTIITSHKRAADV